MYHEEDFGYWLSLKGKPIMPAIPDTKYGKFDFQCSECGGEVYDTRFRYNFCPHCGRIMMNRGEVA